MRSEVSSYHPTQAWWVKVPRSRAVSLIEGDRASENPNPEWGASVSPNPSTPTYVIIMKGDFGISAISHGQHYKWGAVALLPQGAMVATRTLDPIDTKGLTLTPLQLASPPGS
jgi:hypothetical protein